MLFRKTNNGKEIHSMRWQETIRVQSATGKEKTTERELTLLSREIRENTDLQGLCAVTLTNHASVPGYFALRLFWDTDDPHIRGSLLGMNLAQSLKVFGLVDHSIWVEHTNTKEGKTNVH